MRAAYCEPVAGLRIEARHQQGIGDEAIGLALLGESRGHARCGLRLQGAEGRIERGIDRLDLDESRRRSVLLRLATFEPRHAAHQSDLVDVTMRSEKGLLLVGEVAMRQGDGDVAAEQRPALMRKPLREREGEAADARDRRDADRDTGDENAEAARIAEEIAQSVAQGQRQAGRKAQGTWRQIGGRHGLSDLGVLSSSTPKRPSGRGAPSAAP